MTTRRSNDGQFDDDAMWALYDRMHSAERRNVPPDFDREEDEDAENDCGDYPDHTTLASDGPSSSSRRRAEETVLQTVTVRPDLSVRLHVPRTTLEDGCMAEVGGMVWDCSVAMARHLEMTSIPPKCTTEQHQGTRNSGEELVDLWGYDHVVELGSGLGLLGVALYRQLMVRLNDKSNAGSIGKRRFTLTDCVPELVDAMRLSAAEAQATADKDDADNDQIESIKLSVQCLDWADTSDRLDWVIPGESLLIVASEVVYEPTHATILSECIKRLMSKSGNIQRSRILVANFMDRPGWSDFVEAMRDFGYNGKVSVEELDMMGGGGYELLDIHQMPRGALAHVSK